MVTINYMTLFCLMAAAAVIGGLIGIMIMALCCISSDIDKLEEEDEEL